MVFILERDEEARNRLVYSMELYGCQSMGFALPKPFLKAVRQWIPELVLISCRQPQEEALSILRWMREKPLTKYLPVIVLVDEDAGYDRDEILRYGADDCIPKTVRMLELARRIRAIRYNVKKRSAELAYRVGPLCIRPDRLSATLDGAALCLTNLEFLLLQSLMEARGAILSDRDLDEKILDFKAERGNRTMDLLIRTLRQKLDTAGSCVETVRDAGYRFNAEAL